MGNRRNHPFKYDERVRRMTVQNFLKQNVFYANRIAVKYGVPSLVTLAQAAWESGWGKHAPKYNYFGMTAGSNYNGKVQYLTTYEYKNGVKVKVQRAFRAYESPLHAFSDYASNLSNHPNYKDAFAYKRNPEAFFNEVFKGGYATDPDYKKNVLLVMKMIKKHVV